MSDINLNPFSLKERKLLQIGVVLILVLFLIGYLISLGRSPKGTPKNTSVYLENSSLQVFDDTYALSEYPDKVLMHYPYILVIQPSQQISRIHNIETKNKEKDLQKLLLDYDGRNTLYNSGKSTFFNQDDLGILCDLGFIRSEKEVLCVTKINPNAMENKLISIDVSLKKQKELYSSKNLITAVSVIKNVTYVGVNDFNTKKNYLVVGSNTIEFPDIVSFIYEMDSKAYVASLKSAFNSNTESYYLVDGGNVIKQKSGRILLFE